MIKYKMPANQRSFAQTPSTTYVVTNGSNNNNGVYFYSQADVDTWYLANRQYIQKVGSLYLINGTSTGSRFIDVVTGSNGRSQLEHELNNIDDRKTIRDMGREVIIGNNVEPRLLVLRRVQEYNSSTTGGMSGNPAKTGFVVIENNCSDLGGDIGRFTVRVARI